jgi:hypothetical protein
VVVVRRAFIVTFFQRERCAQLHSSVSEVVDEVEVKAREVIISTGSRAVVRAIHSILRMPISQESAAVSPFFNEFVVADSWGVRVRAYVDSDEGVGHHITQDSEIETKSAIRFKRSPHSDERVVVGMTSNSQLLGEIRRKQMCRDTSAAARI